MRDIINRFFKGWIAIFILLTILFFPFSFQLFSFQSELIRSIFGTFTFNIASFLGYEPILKDLSSDSTGLNVLVFLLSGFSIILSFLLLKFASEKTKKSLFYWSYRIAAYYLALILLKYGFDKLFKAQFNLPEPNLLYTELGQLDKDILFWSTMGVSRSYNLFMGIMEVIPALLLLFHRTRILGAFIATGVFINVLSINLSFDISVKLFTSFLLLISVYLAFPGFVDLYRFYILKRTLKPKVNSSKSLNVMILKSIIILVMVIEGLFPYLNTGNFNDDALPRPILHGAYSVENIKSLNEEFPFPAFSLERIFIHRDGYLILQDENGNMTDFSMELDQKNSMIDISDYDGNIKSLTYEYNRNKGTLILDFMTEQPFRIECKALDWRKLPLLQKQFHWTVD